MAIAPPTESDTLAMLKFLQLQDTPMRTFTPDRRPHPFITWLKGQLAIEAQSLRDMLESFSSSDPGRLILAPRDKSGTRRLRGLSPQQAFEEADTYSYSPTAKLSTLLGMVRRTGRYGAQRERQIWGMAARARAQESVMDFQQVIADTQNRAAEALFSGNGELAAQLVMQLEPYDAALFNAATKRNYLVRSFPPRFSPHPQMWSPKAWNGQDRRNWFSE